MLGGVWCGEAVYVFCSIFQGNGAEALFFKPNLKIEGAHRRQKAPKEAVILWTPSMFTKFN